MALLQTRVFLACFFHSTDDLRFELAVASVRNLDEFVGVIAWHIKARSWLAGVVS